MYSVIFRKLFGSRKWFYIKKKKEILERSVKTTVIRPRYPYQSNMQSHRKDTEPAKKKKKKGLEDTFYGKFYFS